jgi:aminopeptidase N
MPGLNLTRDEACQRSRLIAVSTYHVELDFTAAGDTFGSVTTIRFTAAEPGSSTFADLVAARVREIWLNGRPVEVSAAYADGRIQLDGLAADNELRIAADCAYSDSGQGLHRTIDPADGRTYLYTHFEVPDARRLYATFEQPDLKASFRFTISAPVHWTVLSNSPVPEPEPAGPGTASWRFAPTPPISTYITAVVAGEYHIVRDSHATPDGQVIPMAVACRTSVAGHLDPGRIFDITKMGFDYYIGRFGRPYPFEKYDQIFVPEYNIGAMENVGCVTVNERFVFRSKATRADHQDRAEVILHELAHMWFGDLVTMRWWDDLWLKESFATYVSVRCLAEVTDWPAWAAFASDAKAGALCQDQLPTTHPIVADITDLQDVGVNFDSITYAKGASVLKQLVAWVGPEEFFAGAKHYFDAHEWGNTTLADLLGALEQTSGRDLAAWSRDWLRTAGPNTLRPSFTLDTDGRFASFEVLQSAAGAHPTLRSHRLAIGLYSLRGPALVRTAQVSLDVSGPVTVVPELTGAARPDLILVNDDDLSYARIRFDDRSMATLREHIGALTDPLPRALCWTATWDMVRNAELPASDYVALALAGAGGETEIGALETVQQTLLAAVNRYVAPARSDAARAAVAAAARSHLIAATPGSDLQLSWARLFARIAAAPADLELIGALHDGTGQIDGLTVDFDLRWALAGALVRAGQLDADAIRVEQARENTTAAAQYASAALAARPTAAAKAEAWAAVTGQAAPPKQTLDAISAARRNPAGLGFAQYEQAELIRPYVEKYFDALPGIWAGRTQEYARSFVVGFYPRMIIEPQIVERTDEFLDPASPAPALRRMLLEGRDDVVRALGARELDTRQ